MMGIKLSSACIVQGPLSALSIPITNSAELHHDHQNMMCNCRRLERLCA